MRAHILSEIRRLAEAANGKPPGKLAFARQTGIREHQWSGVLWPRWGDALAEAGYERNVLQGRFDTGDVLSKVIEACRHYGHVPTIAEMKLYRRNDPTFPSTGAVAGHFPTRAALLAALARHAAQGEAFRDIASMLPRERQEDAPHKMPASRIAEGFVYLLKSGDYYKIGRSDELERRVREIRITLPEAVTLVHAIKTDDPPGIEAYWHRRFAERRANGEWFKLAPADLAAFKRRKYQ